MTKFSYVLCTVIPLALGSVALAAPPNTPEAPGPAAMPESRHGDFAAWHKEICSEHYARTAGHLAYLQAKLALSEQQTAAFAKWRQAVLDQGAKERATCLEVTPKANSRPTLLERETHLEKILTVKLQSLQATRPALEAVYDSLSTEQKIIFDQEFRHHEAPHPGHPGGMEGHMGMGQGNGMNGRP